jgi:hypothetical protein
MDVKKTFALEMLKFVTDLAEKESDRFWTRFNAMLYSNTALFAILSFSAKDSNSTFQNITQIVVATLGICLSLLWFLLVRLSRFYENRWLRNVENIINDPPDGYKFSDWVTGRREIEQKTRMDTPSNGGDKFIWVVQLVPITYTFIWIGVEVLVAINW